MTTRACRWTARLLALLICVAVVVAAGALLPTTTAWAQTAHVESSVETIRAVDVPASSAPAIDVPADASGTDRSWLQWVDVIWRFKLFEIRSQAVRVNQLIVALLVLSFGLWLSKRLTRLVRDQLVRRGRVAPNAVAVVENITFYLLVITVAVLAMGMVGIPIGTFAFLGGALAIGLGFGAQNILNNFISGLILMIERPIRIDDLVEVEESLGRVAHIGARCTRVRRLDGVDVLVPNSKLLENNVINWTLADRQVRTSVTVGVVYGSPTRQVEQLIRQAVDEQSEILQDPQPLVLFQDFGDNALVFEVFFWVEIRKPMDMRVVRSEVRFRIDELFREANIVIAFPQRDVHLDSVKPIEVRLVGAAQHAPSEGE